MFSKTCIAPLSRLVALRQVQSMPDRSCSLSSWQLARHVFKNEGPVAFWRGNCAMLLHRAVQSGLAFSVITALNTKSKRQDERVGARTFASTLLVTSIGATCSMFAAHPLDVVKTRLITECGKHGSRYYCSTGTAFRTILRDEGLAGFYRGFGVSMISTVPTIALNFAIFDTVRPLVCTQEPATKTEVAMTGSFAAASASAMLFPLDLLKKQLQVSGRGGASSIDAVRRIYRRGGGGLGGLRAFYRGLPLEIAKVAPGGAILFVSNEYLLSVFLDLRRSDV